MVHHHLIRPLLSSCPNRAGLPQSALILGTPPPSKSDGTHLQRVHAHLGVVDLHTFGGGTWQKAQ